EIGGKVLMYAPNASVQTGSIDASGFAYGGTVSLTAGGNLLVDVLSATSTNGVSGVNAAGVMGGGRITLNGGAYVGGRSGGALPLAAYSTTGSGGSILVTSLGNDGNGTSISLGAADVSGVSAG